MIKILPILKIETQRLKKKEKVTTFPRMLDARVKGPWPVLCPTTTTTPGILTFIPISADSLHPPNGSVPAKASPRASPSVAVDFHCLPGGVLPALVEAGTPFQGHASVFVPDLRESNPRVLGATASDPEPC